MPLEIREIQLRAADTEKREVAGIAVPLEEKTELTPGCFEQIARGAMKTPAEGVKLFWQHEEPIGLLTRCEETDSGLEITAKISQTARGDEAYQLVKDGVINRFSIGFELHDYTDSYDEENDIYSRIVTDAMLREVSLVSFPAYDGATLTEVRTKPATNSNNKEKKHMETEIATRLAATEDTIATVRSEMHDLARSISVLGSPAMPPAPVDTRSAGEYIRDIVRGAGEATEYVTLGKKLALEGRADFGGSKMEHDPLISQPDFLKDLTRIVTESAPLSKVFSTAALPGRGMHFEYLQFKDSTITVTEHAEGENVPIGRISKELKMAQVKTYAGGTAITVEEIDRGQANILDTSLTVLAKETGKNMNGVLKQFFKTSVDEQASNALTLPHGLAATSYFDLFDLFDDAGDKFTESGNVVTTMIVTKSMYRAMGHLQDKQGNALIPWCGTTAGVGVLRPLQQEGILTGVTNLVRVPDNTFSDGVVGALVDSSCIKHYVSPVVSLQDTKVFNLTKGFAVYQYGVPVLEIASGLVPIKAGA